MWFAIQLASRISPETKMADKAPLVPHPVAFDKSHGPQSGRVSPLTSDLQTKIHRAPVN